ncbi:TPA: hypothetical protein N0F65_003121 [Lagenidium giganteum]|uniref:2-(3-amino-3-carboxypropyl)histidine synthase subunit 2 n=1 Tax=Lagenidium giganteum TaxID=4803 RepID=A0AAV2YT90_9STRA|nr:TPA: hypothetical protein N0F65_003121 [Lagenidium giganteum]
MAAYRYYHILAALLLLGEAVLGYLIIQKIPYTEIDWKAYMEQVELFKGGERDYIKIRGGTGPLVYPAGFVYLFSVLHSVTDNGEDIRRAQYIFLGFYLITIATLLAIYYRARVCPPWVVIFICVSKRLHSIYMLRLFNDGVAMMLLWTAVYLFMRQKWRIGCAIFSFAVSIKMNVLLFAPALFFLLLQSCGVLRTIWYLFICAAIQIVLALPFLRHNWFSYLLKAFELSRVFTYKWTVNWKFLPEEIFVSKNLAHLLLCGHLIFLILFLEKHFRIIGTFRAVLFKPFAIYEPFPIRAEVIATSMFVINFVGICFARTLHYQFYSWFYPTLPYILWKTNIPMLFKVKALIIAEFAFNTFPATAPSSLALQLTNFFLLITLYFTEDSNFYVPYLDADARQNLLTYMNEECFDGSRQLALYYGSVTEDLAEGASTVSIDEREIILSLPKLKLTLAVGFGKSAPVTSEGYGRQVLDAMLEEATEGVAAGNNMGKLLNREYTKEKERERLDREEAKKKNLRQRGTGGSADEHFLQTPRTSRLGGNMTVALAFETDDGSRAIQTHVEIEERDGLREEQMDVAVYYDVDRTVQQIRTHGFRNIALQFPDSLLPDASRVQELLKIGLEGHALDRIFVLGDTSYGSCCVDEVAAQHLVADCIIHYGRTCLSLTSKIPVIYVFGNAPMDGDHCIYELQEKVNRIDAKKRVILLYEPCYHYARTQVFDALMATFPERCLLLADMRTFYNPHGDSSRSAAVDTERDVVVIGGQPVQFPADSDLELTSETTALLYVGSETAHLTSILLRYNTLDCFSYNPTTQMARREGATVNKALMRRFFLVQKAKEAQIFGILLGTLGVAQYMDVVNSLQSLIKKSGRKAYLFVVGKVNVPKLANFAEIDAFVLVACQQNTLMDCKEFFKPIITPYELQLALSEDDAWTAEYKTDFREVLPSLAQAADELDARDPDAEDADKPFFSLVSGTYMQAQRQPQATASQEALDDATGTALQVKNVYSDLIEYRSEAAEFLAKREYRGLEPRIGETPAHAAVQGSTGIARGYDHEH